MAEKYLYKDWEQFALSHILSVHKSNYCTGIIDEHVLKIKNVHPDKG